MQGEGVLLAIISLAMGLIGFSSIVTALRRSRDKSWTVQEINGLMLLAIMATGAILFSLLPFSLFYMALSEVEVYSIAAAAYLFFTLAVILGLVVRGRQSGFPSRRPRIFKFFAVASVGVLVMMVLVAGRRIEQGIFGYYLFGVIWLLVLAFAQFLVFLSFVGFLQDAEHLDDHG